MNYLNQKFCTQFQGINIRSTLPMEFKWHWPLSSAEISIIRTINIHILMRFMIIMIDLIDIIPYMAVMTDISAFETCQCHLNSTGNWVTEYVHCVILALINWIDFCLTWLWWLIFQHLTIVNVTGITLAIEYLSRAIVGLNGNYEILKFQS